jgi:hypothetical protein
VRQALGILGHRIDVASTSCRGSRFSIFVARSEGGRTKFYATQGEKRRAIRRMSREHSRDHARRLICAKRAHSPPE